MINKSKREIIDCARRLEEWKREALQVMGPVIDYAQKLDIAPLGRSSTAALIEDHARLAEMEKALIGEAKDQSGTLDFGDYCQIEQKRYGAQNEFFTYKVIGRLESNSYRSVPVDARSPERVSGDLCEVVNVICCGVCEERVERFRLCDVKPIKAAIK